MLILFGGFLVFLLLALWHTIKEQQGINHLLGVSEKVKNPWKPKANLASLKPSGLT